mmetsp:Transcript_28790/g.38393  ORF Transcript_28790/g.38393 Transcript_28790/m.38393 type:complete len:99 (-) Transcript_28790:2147-2443(-)
MLRENELHLLAKAARSERQQVDLKLEENLQVLQSVLELQIVHVFDFNAEIYRRSSLHRSLFFAVVHHIVIAIVQVLSILAHLAQPFNLLDAPSLKQLA